MFSGGHYMTRHHMKIFFQNEMFRTFILLMAFFILLLTSCASTDMPPAAYHPQFSSAGIAPVAEKATRLNDELIKRSMQLRNASASSDYRVGPEDLLEINVFQADALKTLARVSSSGYIKLSLIDKIYVSGLTVSELEDVIARQLEKYLHEPMVSLFVKEYRSQQVSVLGSVKDPRVYFVSGQKYLLDIISMAGGLTPEAGSICIIQTVSSGNAGRKDQIEKIVIDLDDILVHGKAELNVPVYAGDIIQIPRSGLFFIDGAVNSPGQFQLKNRTSITQALSMAKGLRFEASRSDIRVYRTNGKPEREVLVLDYDAILANKEPDIDLRDSDVVIVATNGIKHFVKGFTGALNFGMFRVGAGY